MVGLLNVQLGPLLQASLLNTFNVVGMFCNVVITSGFTDGPAVTTPGSVIVIFNNSVGQLLVWPGAHTGI